MSAILKMAATAPHHTNIIAIFRFRDPKNKDMDTTINFLSILFAEIWDIETHVSPFENGCHSPNRPNLVGSRLETRFQGT